MKKLLALGILGLMYLSTTAQVYYTLQTLPVCSPNDVTGEAYIEITSGTPPFTYSWSGPVSGSGTSDTITGLSMGSYRVTVVDALGGNLTRYFSIDTVSVEIHADTSLNCDGSLFLTVIAPNGPGLVWSGDTLLNYGETYQENVDYYASYTVPGGCTVADTFNTGNIPKMESRISVGYYDCDFGSTVMAEVVGASPSQSIYSVYVDWNIGGNSYYIQQEKGNNYWELTHGVYIITGRDTSAAMLAQCPYNYVSDTIFIDADTSVGGVAFYNATINALVSDTCSDELTLYGTPAFQVNSPLYYEWSGPNGFASTDAVVNVRNPNSVGTSYLMRMSTDACVAYVEVYDWDLPAFPDGFTLDVSSTPASCQPNGSATATPSNNAHTYTYLWDTGDTTATITNLAAGIYRVTATDENGCFHTDSAEVVNSNGSIIQLDSFHLTRPTCGISANGDIQIYVSGTNPPFSYLWNTGETTTTIDNLVAGNYSVTITDATGCIFRNNIVLDSTGLQVQVDLTQPTDCATGTGGALLAAPHAGTAPYSYSWSNGATTDAIANLNNGGYTVTVTDDNGCMETVHKNLDPVPLCFSHISGRVYVDADSNCTQSIADVGLAGRMVSIEPGYNAFTDAQGNWQAWVAPGAQYHVSLVSNGSNMLDDACGIDTIALSVPDTATIANIDLPKNTVQTTDVAINITSGPSRPGFQTTFYVTIWNNGTEMVDVNGYVTVDNAFTSIATLPFNGVAIDSVNNAVKRVYYSASNIAAGDRRYLHIDATLPPIPLVAIGQPLTSTAFVINDLGIDYDYSNNNDTVNSLVTGAYDPNDKQVFSGNVEVDGLASPSDTILEYLVRFQNTGNDTAFNIVIRDTLDGLVDPTTFRLLNASHPVYIQFYEDRIIHFNFNNILLPDSNVNEPGSHGFVAYEVKIEEPAILQPVSNQAAIYFDFNPPIYTNTVTTARAEKPIVMGNSSLCIGDTLLLSSTLLPDFTYYWTQNGNPIPNATGASVSVSDSGSYQLNLVFGDDEISSLPFSVTRFAKPIVSLTASQSTVCENAPAVSLTVSPAGGALAGSGLSGTDFNPSVAGAGIHPLQYTYTDGNNCSDTAQDSILVNAKPNVSLSLASNSVCEDASTVPVSVSPAGGTLSGTGVSGTGFDPTIAGLGAHSLTYEYADNNGCADTAVTSVSVNALPNTEVNLPAMPFCKSNTPVDLTSYVSPAGGVIVGDSVAGNMLDVSVPGTYAIAYTYTDNNGCAKTAQANVEVDECIGISEAALTTVQVYPNPSSGIVTVGLGGKAITQLVMLDVLGKQVLAAQYPSVNNATLDASSLANGTYMLKVYNGDTWYAHRIVLQR